MSLIIKTRCYNSTIMQKLQETVKSFGRSMRRQYARIVLGFDYESLYKSAGVFKPLRHEKPWGYEDWVWNSRSYCGKILFIRKGYQSSWHYHNRKDEVLYLSSGVLKVLSSSGDDIMKSTENLVPAGQSFHVFPGLRHRLIALEDVTIFEFSTSHYEEDTARLALGGFISK